MTHSSPDKHSRSTPKLHRQLREILEQKDWDRLHETIAGVPVPELADALHKLEHPHHRQAFRALPRRLAARLVAHVSTERAEQLLEHLDGNHLRTVFHHLEPDDRVQLLESLPDEKTEDLLNLLNKADIKETRELLRFPDESVGRLMNPNCVRIRPDSTVKEALEQVRERGRRSEIVSLLFVVDQDSKLVDTIRLRNLILSDRDATVEEQLDHSFVSLSPFQDREEAVEALSRYDEVALPVIDDDGTFLGIVTVDDILDVAEQEATEDFHKYGAVQPLERRYSETPSWIMYRKRIGWLLVLILVNLMSSGVIAFFEETLESVIALAFFIPLLIGSGGNTGAQSATVMVRAIATGDLRLNQWFKALLKELGTGLLLGLTMGVAATLLGSTYGGLAIGLIVGLAMMGIVLVANLLGTILPFILTRLNVDPAVASSPLITTIADVTGLLIYFGIATAFLDAGLVTV